MLKTVATLRLPAPKLVDLYEQVRKLFQIFIFLDFLMKISYARFFFLQIVLEMIELHETDVARYFTLYMCVLFSNIIS